MLEKLIDFSLRNKMMVLLFTLALIIFGAFSITRLPIDSVPDITNNQVQVITVSPSLGALDIERQVTFPLESSLSNIPGLLEQRSFSRFGLSIVTLVFEDEIDVYLARQQVAERLSLLELPKGVGKPFLAPVTTGLGEIYQYVVKPKKGYEERFSITDLRTIQDWIVRRNLLGTEGVAEVSSFGGKLKQYVLEVDPERLASMKITMGDVKQALQENNANSGGGYLNRGNSLVILRTEGMLKAIPEIEDVVVKILPTGTVVKIKDIGSVNVGFALRYGAMSFNGEQEVSGGIVMMLKGENSSKVIESVKRRINSIQKMLPEGVEIEAFLDRTKMVNNAIGTVTKNLIEGALIVVFILVLFLGTFRAGLVVASVIPLSMLIAVILMNLFNVSGNLMSLGALDFGLIVDGAVIIVEALMHRLHQITPSHNRKLIADSEMDKEVLGVSKKMMNAAVFGQLIILMVYLPILSLEGIEGKMFKPMAQTVAFAIFGAFILSVTYVPVISSMILNKKTKNFSWMENLIHRLERLYVSSLQFVIRKSMRFILFSIVMFIFSLFVLSQMGGEFIPELEEGDFAVEARMLPGTNLETVVQSTMKAAALLKKEFTEVEKVVVKTGSAEIPTDPMPIEGSDLMVILKPKSEWKNADSFDELAEKMSQRLNSIPEIATGFQYPVQMRFNELISGAKQDVVCKVYGDDLDSLSVIAGKIGDEIKGIEGLCDLYVESVLGLPQLVITYDRIALSRYNVSVNQMNEIVSALFAGESVGLIYESEKSFDLTIKLRNRDSSDISAIGNIPVPTGNSSFVPLKELAKINFQNGPVQIQRESAKRRVSIGFNVRGNDVESVVTAVQKIIKDKIIFPVGYSVEYGGQFENLNAAKIRLSVALPIALTMILLLLFFSFYSFKYSILVFSAIPLSSIGGILSLWIRDLPFSISAGVGFIALFGVSVLNGIVLMSEFIFLEKTTDLGIRDIVLTAAKTRLRPVLMTALVASLGFFPMALSTSPGSEVQRPLATVVIGGLVTSTILTLYMLPVLFHLFEHRKRIKHKAGTSAAVLFLLFFIHSNFLISQNSGNKFTVKDALSLAEKNHPSLKISSEKWAQFKQLEKTAFSFPKTEFQYEYGNINSAYIDSKWGITQGFEFPAVYQTRKKLLELGTENQKYESESLKISLHTLVKVNFSKLRYWSDCIGILKVADSIFQSYKIKSARALELGEINSLQQLSAHQLSSEWQMKLSQAQIEFNVCRKQLMFITGADTINDFEFDGLDSLSFTPEVSASSGIGFLILKNKMKFVKLEQKESLSNFFPDFKLGFYNQSISGFIKALDGSENYYSRGDRFKVFTLGLQIPVFFNSAIGKHKAMSHLQNAIGFEEETYLLDRKLKLEQLSSDLFSALAVQKRYQDDLIPSAKKIIYNLNSSVKYGEISYLEWTILNQQAFETLLKGALSNLILMESKINLEELLKK